MAFPHIATDIKETLIKHSSWKDEIPQEIVSTGPFKCRRAWFQVIVCCLFLAVENNLVPSAAREEISSFCTYYTSTEFLKRADRKTTPDDIQRGNKIIALALQHLTTAQAA